MFTGIITDLGTVVDRNGGFFRIRSSYPAAGIALGASICHDGCCLTVTDVIADGTGSSYTLDVSNETLSKTTLGAWTPGRRVNLERALKAGDELGGHIVAGHVDGTARILEIRHLAMKPIGPTSRILSTHHFMFMPMLLVIAW